MPHGRSDRVVVSVFLFFVAGLSIIDFISDMDEGSGWGHLSLEGLLAALAVATIVYLWRNSLIIRRDLREKQEALSQACSDLASAQEQAELFQRKASVFIRGLSRIIDQQMDEWKLTSAEKEVTLLLLKGLSLREIAELRGTTERTVRAQAVVLYEKSGLQGRAELSAFFLEDLLVSSVDRRPGPGAPEGQALYR